MCDPELIRFEGSNVSALYVCSGNYILGHVAKGGLSFNPLPTMPLGGVKFDFGTNAGKGFMHSDGRYLYWAHLGSAFTIARHITLDKK